MKKILFLFIAVLISINVGATKYYIDPTGVDDAGRNGLTTGTAWATLSYACTRAITAGDTIFVNAGTYTETAQSVLAVGVSIMGAGVTSIITTAAALDPIILLASASEGTNGNQSISYIKFDGNNTTAYVAIQNRARSNVKIHHCTFVDFFWAGVRMSGKTTYTQGEPTTYAINNSVYNCNFTNCGREDQVLTMWMSSGAIIANGQENLEIYNDTIDNVTGGRKGYGLKLVGIQWTGAEANWGEDGFFKNLKIHNNQIKVNHEKGDQSWAFSMELWSSRGGLEIYDNDLQGSIDLAGYEINDQYGYGYAAKVYRNTISWDAVTDYEEVGIIIEPSCNGGIYIYRNHFKNLYYGIRLMAASSDITPGFSNVSVYYNIFEDIRISTAGWYGYVMTFSSASYDVVVPFTNIYFQNNVVRNSVTNSLLAVLRTASPNDIYTNIVVKNNIIIRAARIFEFNVAGTYNDIIVTNNDFYNTAFADQWGSVPDTTFQSNITDDPVFVGGSPYSFKLSEGSPAINAGISVGLTTDYGGYSVPVGPLPDIGAWEYGADVTPPNWHPTGLGWDDIYFKNNFRDTVNFTVPPTIAGAPLNLAALLPSGLTATVNDLNATTGATGNLQGQINSLENDKLEKINAALSTGTITDATGITTAMLSRYMYYSEAAATDISSDPQIADGTPGQIITIIGSSDTNTLTLDDSTGLRLSAQCVLGAGDTITLYYDGTLADWIEIGRSNN